MNLMLHYYSYDIPVISQEPPVNVAPWEKNRTFQRKDRIGSWSTKKERNRNGKRYYRNGAY